MNQTSPVTELSNYPPPIVIFATGGSGTRVIAQIIRLAGYFLGSNLNRAGDSLDLAQFFNQHLNNYLAGTRWIDDLLARQDWDMEGAEDFNELEHDFHQSISRHRKEIPSGKLRWGWKGPRSMFLLPFLHRLFPELSVIHLVRDGRDIAYSENQGQLAKHGQFILNAQERRLPQPIQSIILWSKANRAAALYGEKFLKAKYLSLCFEDMCLDPVASVVKLFDFVGHRPESHMSYEAAAAEISPPPSIGRWKLRDPAEVKLLIEAAQDGLRKFGYCYRGASDSVR